VWECARADAIPNWRKIPWHSPTRILANKRRKVVRTRGFNTDPALEIVTRRGILQLVVYDLDNCADYRWRACRNSLLCVDNAVVYPLIYERESKGAPSRAICGRPDVRGDSNGLRTRFHERKRTETGSNRGWVGDCIVVIPCRESTSAQRENIANQVSIGEKSPLHSSTLILANKKRKLARTPDFVNNSNGGPL
jgi:hypothetical protein